ncbi:MAG: SDR family NAD(P)-dependent oxidoreductase [Rhodocyclaceae bacterium]|nr:SDR family NAD(P)-dependent oxidoreductase [Rhodocyclaceae bacterium]MCA3026001.1 SDR family NAD(P)-dependent oxidoreductase [Rhodocyclaceae bacterium]MCA3033277.1 SDR family NAD(P)-dependent oxidoreductase [Rhodocyclaceae bacterium]MCA3036444.1 SDR family NAD(P)-dependent oxidoreductase [Rhodocyclaceae bacterium]MCA3045864.1 SDR family NAD(P)-dependent oxidoreductase [Rhodocyclaceae bacterium]
MRISILTLSGKNDDIKRTVLAVDRKSVRSVRRSERVARLAFYGRQHVAMVARGRRASQDAGQVMTGASGKRMRAFVTGASSGLGAEICLELARRGWDVIGVSRRGIVPQGDSATPGRIEGRTLDVTDLAAVETMVADLDASGGADLYVLNAGANVPATIEDLPMAQARAIMETNFWGVVNIARAALPGLRKRGGGTISVVGSLAGKITPPGEAIYGASKHALEGWCEGLLHEVGRFNIRVKLLAPEFIATLLVPQLAPAYENSAYGDLNAKLVQTWHEHASKGLSPEAAARTMVNALERRGGGWRVPVGAGAIWLPRLRMLIGDRLFLAVTRRLFGM